MKISLIQTRIFWENIDENLAHLEAIIRLVENDCDLVVLPEMFSTGFTMNPEKFSPEELSKIPEWMQKLSKMYNFALLGSSIAVEEKAYYNRMYFCSANQKNGIYDKRHLFRMGEEQNHYSAGDERKIFEYNGWRICPQVCYDLRFPVWSRNRNDYDVLVYVANWPAVRSDAWDTLLKARAIENQSFVIGVNRTGADPNVFYKGGSVVYSPKGKILSQHSKKHPDIITAEISIDTLQTFRKKFPAWMDGDDFTLK